MGSCTGCGGCCYPVVLPRHISKAHLKAEPGFRFVAPGGADADRCKQWVLEDLTRISRAEALRRRPALAMNPLANSGQFFYECRQYDVETRKCRDYENRPSICSGFPWYGLGPVAETIVDLPDCGYREDLG